MGNGVGVGVGAGVGVGVGAGVAVGLGVGVGVGEVAGICTGVGDGSVRRSLLFRASESSLLTPKNPTAMMAITRRLATTICHFQKLPWLLLLF